MADDANSASPTATTHRLNRSLCFSCCIPRRHTIPLRSPSDVNPTLIWIDTQAPRRNRCLSEFKEKFRAILRISGAKQKRHSPADYRYDPLSYSLNFEDALDFDDEAPLNRFSARLPPSPPVPETVT